MLLARRVVLREESLDRAVCAARGSCGPFANTDFYDAFPGWAGHGDCVMCGSTVRTAPRPVPAGRS